MSLSSNDISELALRQGLKVLGHTSIEQLKGEVPRLAHWQEAGFAGEMQYMRREVENLTSPQKLFAEAQSIVVVCVHYDRAILPPRHAGFGRVARYAWGRDYHQVLQERLKLLVAAVSDFLRRPVKARIFSDAAPILERAIAHRAGLGFFGKNTLLIRPGEGSFFFIAEILWDVEIASPALKLLEGSCGTCRRCKEACPTNAIVDDYSVDARRCISYLTIEKRGVLNEWERKAIGEWVFGCDICQEVCPFNHTMLKESSSPDLKDFEAAQGVGPLLDLAFLLKIRSDEEFRSRFRGLALLRAKREGLLRNAAIVAANTGAVALLPELANAALEDSSPVVRQHALWAISELEEK